MHGDMKAARPKLGFVGAGRAGSALAVGLRDAGYEVSAISSREPHDADELAARFGARSVSTPEGVVAAADLTLLTVPDTQIGVVAASLVASEVELRDRAVVHCSARQSARELRSLALAGAEVGVLHPLQSLAGPDSAVNLRGSRFRVEAEEPLRTVLHRMVEDLGGAPIEVPAEALDLYHAAAVLAGNAPIALLARASRLLEQAGVAPADAWQGLAALMQGAAANARASAAAESLTGPVARGDADAVARHLEALAGDPQLQELYRTLVRDMATVVEPRDPAAAARIRSVVEPHASPRVRRPRVA